MMNKLVVAGLFIAHMANASLNSELPPPAAPSKTIDLLFDYQLYSALRAGEVEVLGASDVNGDEAPALKNQLLFIPEGSVLTMVDQSLDGAETTLALDLEGLLNRGDDITGLPSLVKVRTADLSVLKLEMVNLGNLGNEDGVEEYELPAYVAGKGGRRRGMTYCLQDVRLWAGRNCGVRPPLIERAADARAAYLNTGKWKSIQRSSWNAYPKCTACFYGGGRQDCGPRKRTPCGHAAIKISGTRWKGAGTRDVPGLRNQNVNHPVRRRPYKFQGCIIPKNRG